MEENGLALGVFERLNGLDERWVAGIARASSDIISWMEVKPIAEPKKTALEHIVAGLRAGKRIKQEIPIDWRCRYTATRTTPQSSPRASLVWQLTTVITTLSGWGGITVLNKILVGLDGSQGSFKALDKALLLASLANIDIHTVSVEEVPRFAGTIGEVMEEKEVADTRFGPVILKAQSMARKRGVKLSAHLLVGREVKTLVEFMNDIGCDLLVIGFMGHSAVYDRIMGGTCQNLIRLASCSVLVVK